LFLEGGREVQVTGITNQSTGYCPHPRSWAAVRATLSQIGILFPENFTHTFIFRRCEACGQVNVVKDNDYICSVCLHDLPERWNF